jgi:hypothetical protein
MDEVAALAAVLEDVRRLTTQQAVGEDRRHSWTIDEAYRNREMPASAATRSSTAVP